MARHTFGQTPTDWTMDSGEDDGVIVTSEEITFWTAKTGGLQHTDLLDGTGTPTTTIISSAGDDGRPKGTIPEFSGPDGVTEMWADAGGPIRFKMQATDLGGYVPSIDGSAAKLLNVGNLSAGPTEPEAPADGDVWFDTSQNTGSEPVAFVASSGIDNPGSSPGTTCPLPDGLQPGHMMLLAASADVGGGTNLASGPTGWLPLIAPANVGTGDTLAGYWYRVYASGDAAPVITLTTSRKCSAAIAAYSGADPTPDVIGLPGTRADGSSTNLTTAPSVTTDTDDCVAVSLFAEKASGTASITDPAGTTRRAVRLPASGTGSPSVLIVDAEQPTAGPTGNKVATYLTASATASNSDNGRGLQVALKRHGS